MMTIWWLLLCLLIYVYVLMLFSISKTPQANKHTAHIKIGIYCQPSFADADGLLCLRVRVCRIICITDINCDWWHIYIYICLLPPPVMRIYNYIYINMHYNAQIIIYTNAYTPFREVPSVNQFWHWICIICADCKLCCYSSSIIELHTEHKLSEMCKLYWKSIAVYFSKWICVFCIQ